MFEYYIGIIACLLIPLSFILASDFSKSAIRICVPIIVLAMGFIFYEVSPAILGIDDHVVYKKQTVDIYKFIKDFSCDLFFLGDPCKI